MSVVFVDPAGFALDWDWERQLSVWMVRGLCFDRRLAEHQLASRPRNEGHAGRAAQAWWLAAGRDQALAEQRSLAAP